MFAMVLAALETAQRHSFASIAELTN